MEEEIVAEFKKSGFDLDEEAEIAKKCELLFCYFDPEIHFIYTKNVDDKALIFPIRSYLLHKLQSQALGPSLELGGLLSQQVYYLPLELDYYLVEIAYYIGFVRLRIPNHLFTMKNLRN